MKTILPITNGFYKSSSLPVSAQECINCYPVPQQAAGLAPEVLKGTPGLREVLDLGNFSFRNRGGDVMAGKAYVVNGQSLYQISLSGETYSSAIKGTIPGTERVSIAHNGTQMVILIPGGNGYVYNVETNVFVQITDVDFTANGNPLYVEFVDGYFVFTTNEDKFIISALNDATSYNALDFGAAESDPDAVVAPIVYRNQLFITGGKTIEGFQNQGGADFPFVRTGLFMDKGVYSPLSLIKTQDSFMFVGGGVNESPAVWMMAGNGVQKVSTDAIDDLLLPLSSLDISNIYGWTYSESGSFFAAFSLPSTTIVYDFFSSRWHERKSYIQSGLTGCRISGVLNVFNRLICTDSLTGQIGELDSSHYFEYGAPLVRRFVTQPFQNNMNSIMVPSIELTVESGVGNSDAPDPVITMERSVDGRNWIAPRQRGIGKIGEYTRRAIWYRNGRAARFESFAFTMSDPVKFVAIQLTADVVGGAK